MRLKRENIIIIMWAQWKIHFLGKGGGSQKKQYIGGIA